MRLTQKLRNEIPDLPEKVTPENAYEVSVAILNSRYRDKEFTVACLIVEVCELNRELWIAHFTNILRHNKPSKLETFVPIVENFYKFVNECEEQSLKLFGVGIKL